MTSLGRHIIAELYECDSELINDVSLVERAMLDAADKAGATVINSTFHHFSPFGVSGVIVIQESHFSIHCWPEYGYASIDIYTCGETVNPWIAYDSLKQSFSAAHGSTMELNRGQSNLIGAYTKNIKIQTNSLKPSVQHTRNLWFTEKNEDMALSLRHRGERLFMDQSKYQKIEIFDTVAFGKILVLDGKIVCAERDEYVYHEMIAHVPVFTHSDPKNILVIGGGDGGTVRELVKHPNIENITLVEIDQKVIDASTMYLPEVSCALYHSKVTLKIEDGVSYVQHQKGELYDIVIVDSDEPHGPGEGLYTTDFYNNVYRILKTRGILITQSESPRYNVEVFQNLYAKYQKIFGKIHVYCYLMYLPSFPSGMWSFSYSTKGDSGPGLKIEKSAIDVFCQKHKLQYYSFEVHKASFILPPFVKELLR